MIRSLLCILALFAGIPLAAMSEPMRVLFLIGDPSHGWNEHEFPQSSQVLAACLEAAPGMQVETRILQGPLGEKAGTAIRDADVVVLYSDGEGLHIAHGKSAMLRRAWENGTGLVVLHYSLDTDDPELSRLFLDATGGTFEVNWSVNPIWTVENAMLQPHPITRGVRPFSLKDEWYFNMRFRKGLRDTCALLLAHPPEDTLTRKDLPRGANPAVRRALDHGVPQVLAWASAQEEGRRRGFATTGGHYHHSWNDPDFRTLVLNGIVWAGGAAVPDGGVASRVRGLVEHPTIGKAIALGDVADIRRHLERDPLQLNRPIRGDYTPLHMAILRRNQDSAMALIEAGADPDILTGSDQTALHLAAERDLPGLVGPLVKAGVDIGALDHQGWTALHIAAAKDRLAVAKALLASGARVDHLSAAGGTPLHEAAPSASVGMARLLMGAGVDVTRVSDHGVTALDLAREFGNEPLIELLSETGGR